MKTMALYILLSTTLLACTVDYEIDSRQVKKKPVIDGLVTTLTDSSRVILSYTSNDYQTGSVDYINNATVTVSDDTGNAVPFTLTSKEGTYAASPGYAATAGRKYHLKVVLADGTSYEADDELIAVAPIIKIDYIKNPGRGRDPVIKDYPYQIRYHVKKAGGKNYYQVVQYRNGQRYNPSDDMTVYGDESLEDKINLLPTRNRYKENDLARIDLLSISEKVFKYYTDFNNVQNNDGGMFSAPAANPVSNISDGAVGVFQASGNSNMEIPIKP